MTDFKASREESTQAPRRRKQIYQGLLQGTERELSQESACYEKLKGPEFEPNSPHNKTSMAAWLVIHHWGGRVREVLGVH